MGRGVELIFTATLTSDAYRRGWVKEPVCRACIPHRMEGPILSTRYQRDLVAKEALTCGHSGPATTTFQSLQRIGQVETGSDMGGGRRIRCDAVQRRHSRLAGPALASLGLYLWTVMILGRTVLVLG